MNSLGGHRAYTEASAWKPTGGSRPPTTDAPTPCAVATSRRKRAFDLVMSVAVLMLFLPLMLTIAAMVRVESSGPALFRQRRTGLNGEIFTVFKFRTMTVAEDGSSIRQATRGDHRVTRLGAVLRRLSLDELPQLLNVARGEMSLIGPRPHALAHDEAWSKTVPGYARRFRARPGLTGYAAVSGLRGEVKDQQAIVDRVASDNAYIDTWSFRLDLQIVLRTIPLLFGDERAY